MKHIDTDTPQPDSVAMIAKDFSATAGNITPAPRLTGPGYKGNPDPNQYDGVVGDTLTDAEGHAIQALRDWDRAAKDAEHANDMRGWYAMRTYVEAKREGMLTLEEARSAVGNDNALDFYTCIQTAEYIHARLSPKKFGWDSHSISKKDDSFADFEAWQLLMNESAMIIDGHEPNAPDLAGSPELYAACHAIKAWIIAHRVQFAAQTATQAEKGGTAE